MSPPARRGRPPDEKLAAARRQAMIAAASEVFAEKGYVAAGIADIDERLDVGRGTFYRHFESKREILDHVVDDALERLLGAIRTDAPQEAPDTYDEFLAQMADGVSRVFAAAEAEPGLVRLLLLETTSVDRELTLRLLKAVDDVTEVVRQALDHGVKAGFLRGDLDTPVVASGVIYALLPSLLRWLLGDLDDEARARHQRGIVDLIAQGVTPAR